MNHFLTIRGLSEIIFGSIGALPLPTPLGLIRDPFIILHDMSIQETDGQVSHQPVYMAQTTDQSDNLFIAITISKNNNTENILVAKVNDSIVGIKFNWNDKNDCGLYFKMNDGKWLPMSLLDKLIIAAVFQNVVQNDYIWKPLGENKEMYGHLVSLVEDDESGVDN